MKIRRGDLVQVIAGSAAIDQEPKQVVAVLDGGKQLRVEGVNKVLKHVRRGHPKSPQGGRLEMELPIDASNVALYCDSCARGVRVGLRYTDEGAKERFCKKCGGGMGEVSPAKAKYAK
ncbi:MAG: 50S ribosomal protein L24 [Planctomycetaceae bacterium]|nr:50S ribosomal protein L24 [Planctomycetaceae bacterium]